MREGDEIFVGTLLSLVVAVPFFDGPVLNSEEQLVVEVQLGKCFYMTLLTSVLVVELNDQLIPVDPLASSFPLVLSFFL